MTATTRRTPRTRGFTLIELLVIVAILSTVTLLVFETSADDRSQARYNDTRARLQAIERAILGRLGPADAAALGGFAADNGRLPANIAELLSAGSGWQAQEALKPIFEPQPGAKCENKGGASQVELDDASALLVKGHRGNYLGGLAFNGRFRDGWGNENGDGTQDGSNFGWLVTDGETVPPPLPRHHLTIGSLGADNAPGGEGYAADVAAAILPGDWRVPIGGWTVRVVSRPGKDFPPNITPISVNLSASLLVFVNGPGKGHWKQFSSNTINVTCLDGTGDGLVNGSPCAASVDLFFPATQCGESSIPQGRHLLALVERINADGTASAGDKVRTWDDTSPPASPTSPVPRPVVTQITAVAGMALPEARLEIR
ncbi:MAG: type II secretion system protein GspG [Candidatus Accumulibacter sp.]|jgi:type II secretory pathway pseudopilin PulG|nr:type II secretion system protein GspG [Accumulibacter sp.]